MWSISSHNSNKLLELWLCPLLIESDWCPRACGRNTVMLAYATGADWYLKLNLHICASSSVVLSLFLYL